MNYEFQFEVVWNNLPFILEGVWLTFAITIVSLAASLVLGLLIALCRISKLRPVSFAALSYIEVFRNTPALVQLIWIYYCLPILFSVNMSATVSCCVALAMYGAAYNAEIFRSGIQSIHPSQREAGEALAIRPMQVFWYVIFPQALPRSVGPLINEGISLLKFSSLVSIFGVADLTYQGQVLATSTYRPIEIFTTIGIIYFVINLAISQFVQSLQRRFVPNVAS